MTTDPERNNQEGIVFVLMPHFYKWQPLPFGYVLKHMTYFSFKNQQLGTSFHLIQQWEDVRLQYDVNSIRFAGKYVLMDLDKYVTIWTPDSYISNALTAVQHSVTKPNVFIRVYPNGTLVKSTRLG